jgi:hypothetical protein
MLTGGEDAVDVGDLQTGIPHSIMDRLQMERQLAFVGQCADLIALVNAHNTDGTAELFHRSLPLASGYTWTMRSWRFSTYSAGRKSGMVTSSVSFSNTTSTGMSHLTTFGSGSTLMRLDIMCGPSSSSTMANTYGGLIL